MLRRLAPFRLLEVAVLLGTLSLTFPLAYGLFHDEPLIHAPSLLGTIVGFFSFAYLNATSEKKAENVSIKKDHKSLY